MLFHRSTTDDRSVPEAAPQALPDASPPSNANASGEPSITTPKRERFGRRHGAAVAAVTIGLAGVVGAASIGLPRSSRPGNGVDPAPRLAAAGDGARPGRPLGATGCVDPPGDPAPAVSAPRVVVVGDALTVQSRPALESSAGGDLQVIASCASSVATTVGTGVLGMVATMKPEVVVLAFGPGDLADGTAPDLARLDGVVQGPERALDATDDVACRVVVNVDTTGRGTAEPDASMWRAFSVAFNDRIGGSNAAAGIDHRRHRHVELVDWAGEVDADPGLVDGANLTAAGIQRRADLITAAVARGCPDPPGTPAPSAPEGLPASAGGLPAPSTAGRAGTVPAPRRR